MGYWVSVAIQTVSLLWTYVVIAAPQWYMSPEEVGKGVTCVTCFLCATVVLHLHLSVPVETTSIMSRHFYSCLSVLSHLTTAANSLRVIRGKLRWWTEIEFNNRYSLKLHWAMSSSISDRSIISVKCECTFYFWYKRGTHMKILSLQITSLTKLQKGTPI